MRILVINSGSSSLKFQVVDPEKLDSDPFIRQVITRRIKG